MRNRQKEKSYTYEYSIHPVWQDPDGRYYCRAANAVFKPDTIFCWSCPLLGGFTQGEQQGNPECHFYELEPRDYLNAKEDKKRTDGLIQAGIVPEFPDFMLDEDRLEGNSIIEEALQFAAVAHKGTCRKGTKIPYITHCMEVGSIVSGLTNNPHVIAAAILHDVVEDTKYTLDDIEKNFGKEVSYLVDLETENKQKQKDPVLTWKIRKREFLDHLNNAPKEAKMITLGDKLSNMRAIKRDYDRIGDSLWERFNQKDKDEQGWYYKSIRDKLTEFSEMDAWEEYDMLVRNVFGEQLVKND